MISPEGRARLSESRRKLGSPWNVGREVSEETRKKSSESKKGDKNPRFGKPPWNKGKKLPDWVKKKLSEAHMGKFSGEFHPRWIHDRSKVRTYDDRRNDAECKQWHKKVLIRDEYRCRMFNSDCEGRVEVHHILGWTGYSELRYKTNNGITLCHAHHPKGRAEEKRFEAYLIKIVASSVSVK